MNISPRQLLTSGTAAAAVVGAVLLGAEDVGLAPFTRAHRLDDASLWALASQAPATRHAPRRAPADARGSSAPR
jgi:hypothetical protein